MTARRRANAESIVLLGAGRMGRALLAGWLAKKTFPPIHVVDPAPSKELLLLAKKRTIGFSREFVPVPARAIVLAVKPQVIRADRALQEKVGQTNAPMISIIAGITTDYLFEVSKNSAPIVRTVPNTPGAIGLGITAIYCASVSRKIRRLAEAVLAPLGSTLWVEDEAMLDAITGLSGSGPAYVFLLVECLAKAGEAQGLNRKLAVRLARQTVIGAGALLSADTRPAENLRADVTSPGGTTEAALKILMGETGLQSLMMRAVEAATRRSRELGS